MATFTLNLEPANSAGEPYTYPNRVEDDRIENANATSVDAFAGKLTSSFCSTFFVSGTSTANLGMDIGAEYSPINKVITEVLAFCPVSGSGGVTTIDVQRQQDGVGTAFVSIFSNAAFRPALSSSLGNYGIARSSTISGTLWPAGTILKASFTTAATLQRDVTVVVTWKPSASYGA